MIALSASISIGDAAVDKLVPLARVQDVPVTDPCDPGPDFNYPTTGHLLPRVLKVYRCWTMRLGSRDAIFIDAVVDREHRLAVYDADGSEIVPLTAMPFDPYEYNYSMIHAPYYLADLDGDGSDEIVMTDAFSKWIRVVAVRGHTLMTTPEHPYIGYSDAHPRWFYARDTLVPLSSVVAAPVGSYVCGAWTFALSKPGPLSKVVTVYRTDTHRVIAGPRAYAWYPPTAQRLHSPCRARLETDYDGVGYAIEDW